MHPLLLLIGPALGGAPPATGAPDAPWYALPVAAHLHPVQLQPGLAWQRAMATAMAGPGASSYYRDTATELDVRWRLEMEGLRVEPATSDMAHTALDLSLTGAVTGLNRLLHDALAEDDVLGVAQEVVRAALSPGLLLQRTEGGFHVELDDRSRAIQQGRAAVLEGTRRPRNAPPQPSMRVGTGLRLTDEGDRLADDLVGSPAPALGGWFGLDHMGVDALLLDATWIDPWGRSDAPRLRWGLTLRDAVWNGFGVRASLISEDTLGLPDRAQLGVSYALNTPESWTARLDGVRRFPTHEPGSEGEWRVEIGLRANLDWVLPVDIDRWPLGQEVGAPGPTLPSVRRAGPNESVPVRVRPVDR